MHPAQNNGNPYNFHPQPANNEVVINHHNPATVQLIQSLANLNLNPPQTPPVNDRFSPSSGG